MLPHLLFLWCTIPVDPNPTFLASFRCTQEIAFKMVDGGEMLPGENDFCEAAMGRWLDRKELVYTHNAEALEVVCEIPLR